MKRRIREWRKKTDILIFTSSTLEMEEFFNIVFIQTYLLIEKYVRLSDNQSLKIFTNASLLNQHLSSKLSTRWVDLILKTKIYLYATCWTRAKTLSLLMPQSLLSPLCSPHTSAISYTILFSCHLTIALLISLNHHILPLSPHTPFLPHPIPS